MACQKLTEPHASIHVLEIQSRMAGLIIMRSKKVLRKYSFVCNPKAEKEHQRAQWYMYVMGICRKSPKVVIKNEPRASPEPNNCKRKYHKADY
jgi:hypothetical protein